MQMPATDRFADWRPEWTTPILTEMPYTPELRALYYNTADPQDLEHDCGQWRKFIGELNPQNRMGI
jgi:hypothetical protein